MSFLAIDIGNTRLKWALYAAPQPGAVLLAHGAVFLETIDELAESEWNALAGPPACSAAWSPARRSGGASRSSSSCGTSRRAGSCPARRRPGRQNGYDHPNRLGADRWVALVGARQRVLARARRGRRWW